MQWTKISVMTLVVALASSASNAEILSLGATKGGLNAMIAASISKVGSKHTDSQMRPQPMGGTQQYIPVVNAGEINFGTSNSMQYSMAVSGTGLSKGRKYDNLRLVSNLMTLLSGFVVRADSDIKSIADLKGKRVPYGFNASPLFHALITGFLANGGRTWDDVVRVPVVAMRQHWDMLKQGRIDVAAVPIGAAPEKQAHAAIPSGIRQLPYVTSGPNARKALAMLPTMFFTPVTPVKFRPSIRTKQLVFAYNYTLWTNKSLSGETVYKVVKAMYENEAELKSASPAWRSHGAKMMPKNHADLPYHPGAVKFYREVGIWKR